MRSLPFVLLTLASLWILYRGLRPEPVPAPPAPHVHPPAAPASRTVASDEPATQVRFDNNAPGYRVYRERGCGTCHGADGLGDRMGPSLADVRLHYDTTRLGMYLREPSRLLAEDERLQQLQARYPRVEMPSYPDLGEEDLEALAGFLLEPGLR